jgi:hypothetical protein
MKFKLASKIMLSLCYEKIHEVPHLVLMLPPNPTWHPMWCKKLKEYIMNGISTPLLICFTLFS